MTDKLPVILSLCDYTGVMVAPWAEAGFQCVVVDVQHPAGTSKLFDNCYAVGRDVNLLNLDEYQPLIVFSFPPCTHLAGSGARWWKGKGIGVLIESLQLVDRCRKVGEDAGCPWMLENPVGRLSTCWRQPDYKFDPCDYGGYQGGENDNYTKKTCLWTGGGFVMPQPKRIEPVGVRKGQPNAWYSKVGGKSEKTKNYRSQTAKGFARAVFEANVDLVRSRM